MIAKMATKLIDSRFGHGPGNWIHGVLLSLPEFLQQVPILMADIQLSAGCTES